MAMVVTNNTSAMNTSRWLNINQANMQSSLAKLSSGYKINTAADNPAGLVISEKLRAQLSGLSRAVQNNQEASNVIGIAEGALREMNEILKGMKELSLHAANSGITSTDQIIANQAEMDSAVQTIDRIANTTKFSDTYLLNGTQSLKFSTNTVVDSTSDNTLINSAMTDIYQVSDLSTKITISYTGEKSDGTANMSASAQKACIEALSTTAGVDMDGTSITADLALTIEGALGSKSFSFGDGQQLGSVAATINNSSSSTGVAAQLIFGAEVTGADQDTTIAGAAVGDAHATGEICAYELDKDFNRNTNFEVTDADASASTVVIGANTDADGCVYAKITGGNSTDGYTYNLYKDSDMTMLVGTGITGQASTEANNSGIVLNIDIAGIGTNEPKASDVIKLQIGAALEVGATNGGITSTTYESSTTGSGGAEGASVLTGVRLGENTDENGKIYAETIVDTDGNVTVNLYNDSGRSEKNLMATGTLLAADITSDAVNGIEVYAVTSNGGNSSTGLYGTINISLESDGGGTAGYLQTDSAATYTSEIYANDLGIRLSSTEYGEDAFVTVNMEQGALFTDNSGKLIDKSNSGTDSGQSATVTINGTRTTLDQLSLTVASTDLNASLVFNEGSLGMTTVAVAGYTEGALASKAGAMTDNTNHATQTLSNTSETIGKLNGGVQLQLGEGTNNYESTVVSISSMTATDLGKVTFVDDFNGNGLRESKTLTLTDLQSGGLASLAVSPDRAIKIIEQAIDDVSMTRARLGAIQSNMLQTNINSLNVAIENITSTESAIRDTDMATESTNYTKNQILVQAATSMLAQANTLPQQALSLLQG